jgi:type IV pilus assembly protein PilB
MSVLVASGNPATRQSAVESVEESGREALKAVDGNVAWELLQNDPEIEAVVCDQSLEGMDGEELCRRVTGSRGDEVLCLLVTERGYDFENGAHEHLAKPLDPALLKEKLDKHGRNDSMEPDYEPPHTETMEYGGASPEALEVTGSGGASDKSAQGSERRPARRVRDRLGDILVSHGKISDEQLQSAVSAQRGSRRELGEVLVSLGLVSKEDLGRANAERLRLEFVELTDKDVDRGVLELFPEKVLRRHRALPLRIKDGRLIIAIGDPTNIHAMDDLKMISGYQLTPVVATEEDIGKVQTKFFAGGESLSGILEDTGGEGEEESQDLDLGSEATPDERPVIRLVSSVLQQAVSDGASDIHIEPRAGEVAVRFRVDGVLREVMSIPPRLQSGVIARLKIIGDLDIAERRIPQDGRFSVKLSSKKVDFRVASLPTVHGEKVVLRLMDTASVETDLRKLGFARETFEAYEEIFKRPYGAILVTGPTGSGKSTTLYATLKELNSEEKNIITVEDPVELRVQGVNQIQVNPRAGLTFASGLRSILRSDPDIVMIGEIRDQDTAKISVEAALTGHLVLATLHTNNAPGALTRLTEMGVEPFLTSSAVDCVIAQRLARKLCSRCKQPIEVEEAALEEMRFPFESVGAQPRFYKAVGCERCGGTGYRGRVGIYEMMVVTEEIRELILRRVSTAEISRAAEAAGMVRLREDGMLKAARGETTLEEVLRTVL